MAATHFLFVILLIAHMPFHVCYTQAGAPLHSATASTGSTLPTRPASWASQDPKSGQWVFYASDVSERLEAAHRLGHATTSVTIGTSDFTVSFHEMRQYNKSGGFRPIKKMDVVRPSGASMGDGGVLTPRHSNTSTCET